MAWLNVFGLIFTGVLIGSGVAHLLLAAEIESFKVELEECKVQLACLRHDLNYIS